MEHGRRVAIGPDLGAALAGEVEAEAEAAAGSTAETPAEARAIAGAQGVGLLAMARAIAEEVAATTAIEAPGASFAMTGARVEVAIAADAARKVAAVAAAAEAAEAEATWGPRRATTTTTTGRERRPSVARTR